MFEYFVLALYSLVSGLQPDILGTPLRPIVSSIGAVTYSTSKELSRILKPLVGKSPYHICNNHDFIEDLKTIKLGPEE